MSNDYFSGYILGARLTQYTHNRIYEARSADSPVPSAIIKIFSVRRLSDEETKQFLQEADVLTSMRHPAILPLLATGVKGRLPYIIMPYVRSGSLREHLMSTPISMQNALSLITQLGRALNYAHQRHIVHGNIKPENILFLSSDRVCLMDFRMQSLAPLTRSTFAPTSTHYPYWAPEQFYGPPTQASDQYALGCVAYELLTGHLPIDKQKTISLSPDISPLSDHKERVILKALAKDPEQRYVSVAQFMQALQAATSFDQTRIDETSHQLPAQAHAPQWKLENIARKVPTKNLPVVALAVVFVLCSLLIFYTLFFNSAFAPKTSSQTNAFLPGKSSIVGSLNASPLFVNLTTEGTTDWEIWGYQGVNHSVHKSAGHGKISPITYINFNQQDIVIYGGSQTQYSWSDGTPTTSTPYIEPSGIELVGGKSCGFQFTVPASTTVHTLRVYVGVDDGQGNLVATLSDGTSYHDTTFSNVTTVQGDFYVLRYQASSNNQILKIQYTVSNDPTPHSIMLQAVTLQ